MTASPFRVSVANLLRSPGSSRRVSFDAALSGLQVTGGGVPPDAPLSVSARLDGLFEGVWFEGTISGTFRLECVRCLREVDQPFSVEAEERFGSDIAPDSDEGYPLKGEEIDLEPLVRDAIILSIPTNAVCDPACRGLCAQCGADLNENPCDCRPETGHPALKALADLFPTEN
jgi:uncharacterized protein